MVDRGVDGVGTTGTPPVGVPPVAGVFGVRGPALGPPAPEVPPPNLFPRNVLFWNIEPFIAFVSLSAVLVAAFSVAFVLAVAIFSGTSPISVSIDLTNSSVFVKPTFDILSSKDLIDFLSVGPTIPSLSNNSFIG